MSWPLEGGQTKNIPVDRNLRGFARRGGELAETVVGYLKRFPQLAKPGTTKIAYGKVTVKMGAALTTSAYSVITHGMGVTPTAVATSSNSELEGVGAVWAEAKSVGATTFEIRACRAAVPGKEISIELGWVALG